MKDYTAYAFYAMFLYFFVHMFLWVVGITL